MNIACILDSVSRNAGGLYESVRRLAQSLGNENTSVKVFGLRDEFTTEDAPAWSPLPLQTFRAMDRGWGFAPQLFPALMEANLDVLLTHGLWKYSSVASLSWHRRTGCPHIIHPHGMLDPWAVRNSGWKKRIAAALYEDTHLHRAACLRALNESEARSIRAYGLRNPICVIPNGIDLPDLRSEIPPPSPAPSISAFQDFSLSAFSCAPRTLLYLGRLHPKKNLGPLLEAWAAVQRDSQRAKEWTLAIAGWDQGGYQRSLEVLCSTLNVQSSVQFLGPKFGEEKAACYRQCAGFILPSLSEGLPMVVLEAWAYGKPVLMTDECNLPEGFTTNAALRIGTESAGIAQGLRAFMEMSDAERASMGARGQALAASRFSWKSIGEEMRRVCEWAVGGGPKPESVLTK